MGRSRSRERYYASDVRRKRSKRPERRRSRSSSIGCVPPLEKRHVGGRHEHRDRYRSRSKNHDRGHSRSHSRDHCQSTHSRSNDNREGSTRESWSTIMLRLQALESQQRPASPGPSYANGTEQIVEAIQSLKSVSTHSYYVSNFDPSVHDVDSWFEEVDRAKVANRWDDRECLARVGRCLKGDAKSWLDEWVTNDRSWSNFKTDFKCLCVNRVDRASILYEMMSTDSNGFRTYAEYARKSLLRLRIVKGLSDDLIIDIILRGIKDPQVKAAATNANLTPQDLVGYLATFLKPEMTDARATRRPVAQINSDTPLKRPAQSWE